MTKRVIVVSVCAIVVLWAATIAMAADNLSGTWKINVAKSKYSPGPAPKSGSVKIELAGDTMKIVQEGVNAEGKPTRNEYTYKFDGKDYPMHPMVDGKPDPNVPDTISAKKIDDFTYETTAKLKGNVVTTSRIVVSKDGKSRTNTQTGKDAQGRTVNNVIVYDRQ